MKRPKDEVKVWTWRDCERAMERYAEAKACEAVFAAELRSAIVQAQECYQAQIAHANWQAQEQEAKIREFAKIHRKEFRAREEGGDTRSYEHAEVVIGYRTTPPTVRIEDEEAAVEFLDEFSGGVYLRVKQEPNREALRDALLNDDERTEEKLAAHGITLQQKDKFFIEVRDGE